VTGFGYEHDEAWAANLELFKHFTDVTQGVRRLGAAAVDLCHVALGAACALPTRPPGLRPAVLRGFVCAYAHRHDGVFFWMVLPGAPQRQHRRALHVKQPSCSMPQCMPANRG